MPRRLRRSLVLVALLLGCNGPLPFLSGGELEGEAVEAPERWSEWDESYGVIQFETNPAEPYSVNIAYTVVDERLYVYAGDTETKWVEHMQQDPRVRLRRGDSIYALRAERVSDAAEVAAFAKAWTEHGAYHRDPLALDEVWLYRLTPR